MPVLTLPPLVDTDNSDPPNGLVSRLFRRRRESAPAYYADAVTARIEDALAQSKRDAATCEDPRRPARLLPPEPEPSTHEEYGLARVLDADLALFLGFQPQQDRAQRWERNDLPWLESISLTWGAELQLLNISSSGLLVESCIRMTLGNLTEFQLAHRDERDYVMPGRIVRSDVASVNRLGVRYVAAAVFETPFESIGPE